MKRFRSSVLALALLGTLTPLRAMDLDAAIAAAEKNDPALASAQANRDAAYENIAIARAKLLPQTSFQSLVQKIEEGVKQDAATPAGGSIGSSYLVNAYNNQFSLRQGLYHPRDWMGYDIGQLQSEYGAQKLASARSDLWVRTTNAWLDVLSAVELRRIYEQTVKTTGFAAEQAEKRFKAGDGTRDAAVEARAQHELAKSQLLEAEINQRSREQAFKRLTGLEATPLREYRLPDYRQVHLAVSNSDELQQIVSSTNPEILAAQAAEQVNIPLYDGGGLSATQRQAEFAARASSEDLRTQQVKLATQVESDWAAAEASLERARSAEVLIAAAQEQKRAAEMGLKSGIHTWGEVAQADILIARRASDYLSYASGVLREQARLLSAVPVTENIWEPWVAQISQLAKP